MFANGAASSEPDHAVALARAAERLGYDSLWAVQHVVMPVGHESRYPYAASGTVPGGVHVAIPDPLVWLAFVAAATERIRLATGILVLPQQHALVVAKQAATLDRLSGGRLLLGVGAGWLAEEFAALGASFDDRGARLDEQIEALRRAWRDPIASFTGSSMSFSEVVVEPRPVAGVVPIVVGGHTAAAARRAGRTADGFFPLGRRGDALVTLVDEARSAAALAGRDPWSLEITADAPRTSEQADVLLRLRVDRVLLNAPAVPTASLADALAEAIERVRATFASVG